MRSLSPATAAALSGEPVLIMLVEMLLTSPLRLNTSGWTIAHAGADWLGTGGLGSVEAIESDGAELKGLRFEISGTASSRVSTALSEPVQGRPVNIYTAIATSTPAGLIIHAAELEWPGRLDTMSVAEQGDTATISVTAEHIGIDLLRPAGINFSDQDQQRLHPGDRFFKYVINQAEADIVWPAASWYKAQG